ncbi:glucokinase [Desulfovibrio sp. OttesenSCG-928-C14]|nr:glucokinase [Desulfovibrio sp. OttesenSCG-928-C14]
MNGPAPGSYILAADIGGTSSRFALFRLEEEGDSLGLALLPESKLRLPTAAHSSFPDLLARLRSEKCPGGYALLGPELSGSAKAAGGQALIRQISLAVPGPVRAGFCRAPNVQFTMSEAEIASTLGLPGSLLNDFKAQGLSCLLPEILGLQTLVPGKPDLSCPAVVMGAGTGLGKALILPQGDGTNQGDGPGDASGPCGPGASEDGPARCSAKDPSAYADRPALSRASLPRPVQENGAGGSAARAGARILPSEGGHSLFPFAGKEEFAFALFASELTGGRELIGDLTVTGHGLALLVAYFAGLQGLPSPEEAAALLPEYPGALEWLARFYGRACRDMVLETLALGGVFLSGGMLSHVPQLRGHPAFSREFRLSQSQEKLLAQVPIWWISNQDAGLWGAALHGAGFIHA